MTIEHFLLIGKLNNVKFYKNMQYLTTIFYNS